MKKNGLLVGIILLVGLIFIGRLFYLQILDNPYKTSPLNNASIKSVYDYPARGYIYDRNGELMARNINSYHAAVKSDLIKNKENFILKIKLNFPDISSVQLKKKLESI